MTSNLWRRRNGATARFGLNKSVAASRLGTDKQGIPVDRTSGAAVSALDAGKCPSEGARSIPAVRDGLEIN